MGRPATLKVDIVADAKGVGRGVSEAESKFAKLGKAGRLVGTAAAAGLAAAGAAAVAFGVASVKSASSVQQSFGALDTVYGKSAGKVKRWASNAADSVGLAKSEYAGLAALIGSQLQGMGMAQDKSAGKSKQLIKLGADLAATYGGSVNDAVEAVSSTLKGETDPIERYGVSIKQADVNARLASLGLQGLTGKAAKQAQAQAVLSLVTEQTRKAQGAFGRESNTLAGQQERLKAKFENVKAAVGQRLLPVLTRMTAWLGDKALPAAVRLGQGLARQLGPTITAVGRWITGSLVPAVQRLVTWFNDKLVPGIRRYATPALNGIRGAFRDVKGSIDDNRPAINKILNAVRIMVEFFVNKVMPIVGKQVGMSFRAMGKVISATIGIVSGITDAISATIGAVRDLIGWLGRIHVPDIKLPSRPGWLGGAADVYDPRPKLLGWAPSYDSRRSYSTAGTDLAGASTSWGSIVSNPASWQQVVVVDRRDLSVTVQLPADPLGLVDEAALARRLRRILDKHAVRVGSASTLRLS